MQHVAPSTERLSCTPAAKKKDEVLNMVADGAIHFGLQTTSCDCHVTKIGGLDISGVPESVSEVLSSC